MIRLSQWRPLLEQAKSGLARLRQSKFARQAAWLFVLNVISKGFGFFGSAYASRSLGPTNIGISGLVLATAQQVSLTYDGGFSVVGVRKIAADKENSRSIIETINTFQLGMALIASVLWMIFVWWLAPVNQRLVWSLGMVSLIFSATSIAFVFQGLEKLPIQTAIGAVGSILTAGAYFLFFSPGMFLGADLIVISAVGLLGVFAAWVIYFWLFGRLPVGRFHWGKLRGLLHESWRYWLLSVAVYFYSVFQIPLIVYLLGAHEAGIYRSAYAMAAGVELLFNSITALLLARMVNWKKMGLGVMWRRQGKLFLVFLMIGVPIVGILIFATPTIYSLLLGDAFQEGILVFQILIIGRLVVFLGQIYALGLVATGQDNKFLGGTLLGTVMSVSMNLLLIPKFGLIGAAGVSVTTEVLIHSYFFLVVREKVRYFR